MTSAFAAETGPVPRAERALGRFRRLRRFVRAVPILGLFAGTCLNCDANAADGDRLRDYFVLRAGPAVFNNADESPHVELENPALEGVLGGAIGVNMTRRLGTEFSFEYMETALLQTGTGQKIGEYGLWMLLAQARLRYPIWGDTVTPYLVGGAGVGFGEMNDRNFLNAGIPG